MKKFYLGALGCLLAMGANAQTLNLVGNKVQGSDWGSIGKQYTNSGISIPYIMETNNEIANITLYDENFEAVRSLSLDFGSYVSGCYFLDLDKAEYIEGCWERILITQSLFNNDEKVEFIRTISDDDREIAFEIVNEDNEVLTRINCDQNSDYSYAKLLKWGDNFYFCISSRFKGEYHDYGNWGEYDYTHYWDVYLIEKETNSIRKVNAAPLMSVMPALAERNSTVNVTLDAETLKNGGELVITDSNGRTVSRSHVEAGQTSAPVTTDRMSSGVYNITLTEKGQKIENARIIVK